MNEINGQYGGKVVHEHLLDSGEIVYVQPLSIYLVNALRDKARELYPFPNKTDYERTLDDAKAIEPGQVIPAEENPDYQKLYDEAERKQQEHVNEKCVALSVEPVQGREAMIAKYKDRIAQLRELMTLPEDAWEATLKFCIMTSRQDFNKITNSIMGQRLPGEEDILNGMRIFRCYVRQDRANGSHSGQEPSGITQDDTAEPQHHQGTVRLGASVGVADSQPDDSKSQSRRTERDAGA